MAGFTTNVLNIVKEKNGFDFVQSVTHIRIHISLL